MILKKAFKEFGLFLCLLLLICFGFIYAFYSYNNIQVPLLNYFGINFPNYESFHDYGYTFLFLNIIPLAFNKATSSKTELKFFNIYVSLTSLVLSYFVYHWVPVKFLGLPALDVGQWFLYIGTGVLSYLPLGLILLASYFVVMKFLEKIRNNKKRR